MKEENIGVLSAGERFGFKGFEWIVLDNNVDAYHRPHKQSLRSDYGYRMGI